MAIIRSSLRADAALDRQQTADHRLEPSTLVAFGLVRAATHEPGQRKCSSDLDIPNPDIPRYSIAVNA